MKNMQVAELRKYDDDDDDDDDEEEEEEEEENGKGAYFGVSRVRERSRFAEWLKCVTT